MPDNAMITDRPTVAAVDELNVVKVGVVFDRRRFAECDNGRFHPRRFVSRRQWSRESDCQSENANARSSRAHKSFNPEPGTTVNSGGPRPGTVRIHLYGQRPIA